MLPRDRRAATSAAESGGAGRQFSAGRGPGAEGDFGASCRDGATVLVTGGAGFLGKVILERLLREREALGLAKVVLLIRPRGSRTPRQRFESKIARSPAMSRLPLDWQDHVEIVGGDLLADDWGMTRAERRDLARRVTHIIHAAASVDFSLPLDEAAAYNVTASLAVMDFAAACPRLSGVVAVSTAYVRPHQDGPCLEELVPLQFDPSEVYRGILEGRISLVELLAKTGHPNSYALTKCLAEHLIVRRRGAWPLTIVRPSIISAALRDPFPGWIDSRAALAAFVVAYGTRSLRVVAADSAARLDVVPVDAVAHCVVERCFRPAPAQDARIVHAVAGAEQALSIELLRTAMTRYFRAHADGRAPRFWSVAPYGLRLELEHWLYQRLPLTGARLSASLLGRKTLARRVARLERAVEATFRQFPYFTHRTFDFRSAAPVARLSPAAYARLVCEGVDRHLLGGTPHRRILIGRRGGAASAVRSATPGASGGGLARKGGALALEAVLARVFTEISFDQASLERALEQCPPDSRLVVAASYRSHLDPVLCGYLFGARMEPGLAPPWRLALPGFLRSLGELGGRRLHRSTTLLLLEGARSASWRFLPPRVELLTALQEGGEDCTILPVALSYDRVPEEAELVRQLRGAPAEALGARQITRGLSRLAIAGMACGSVHVSCGAPVRLTPASDAATAARAVMAQLQLAMSVPSHHVDCFVHAHPRLGWSREQVTAVLLRCGVSVRPSSMPTVASLLLDPCLERAMRRHWEPFVLGVASGAYAQDAAVRHYIGASRYAPTPTLGAGEVGQLAPLLEALAAPVREDYARMGALAEDALRSEPGLSRSELLERARYCDLPTAELALDYLVETGQHRSCRISQPHEHPG